MDTPVEELGTDELRAARDGLRAREESLSYERRLLQGQLDILRGDGGLVEELTDRPGAGGASHRALRTAPPDVVVPALPALDELGAAARADLGERLAAREAAVSDERQRVQQRLDALQEELVRRYRDDGVDVARLTDDDG